jgi:hypothetical protein
MRAAAGYGIPDAGHLSNDDGRLVRQPGDSECFGGGGDNIVAIVKEEPQVGVGGDAE